MARMIKLQQLTLVPVTSNSVFIQKMSANLVIIQQENKAVLKDHGASHGDFNKHSPRNYADDI